jgi:hypothetical protein
MAVLRQLELILQDIEDEDDVSQKSFLIRLGTLITILTAASLRGNEGFYLNIAATMKHLAAGRNGVAPTGGVKRKIFTEKEASSLPEICICLLGKFKGETGERTTPSSWQMNPCLVLKLVGGLKNSWTFANRKGKPLDARSKGWTESSSLQWNTTQRCVITSVSS